MTSPDIILSTRFHFHSGWPLVSRGLFTYLCCRLPWYQSFKSFLCQLINQLDIDYPLYMNAYRSVTQVNFFHMKWTTRHTIQRFAKWKIPESTISWVVVQQLSTSGWCQNTMQSPLQNKSMFSSVVNWSLETSSETTDVDYEDHSLWSFTCASWICSGPVLNTLVMDWISVCT